jgi:hypothetical protein
MRTLLRSAVPLVCAGALVLLVAACGGSGSASQSTATPPSEPPAATGATGAVPWPAPADAAARARFAGVPIGRHEYGIPGYPGKHIHAHLDVFVNGKPARVPAAIGIQKSDPGV